MKFQLTVISVTALFIAGCSTMPGSQEGATPPKLVTTSDGTTWDNPAAFGPVPASLAAAGAKVCDSLNTKDLKFVARGYHSKALDLNGRPFPSGGYFCVRG